MASVFFCDETHVRAGRGSYIIMKGEKKILMCDDCWGEFCQQAPVELVSRVMKEVIDPVRGLPDLTDDEDDDILDEFVFDDEEDQDEDWEEDGDDDFPDD